MSQEALGWVMYLVQVCDVTSWAALLNEFIPTKFLQQGRISFDYLT